MTWLFIIICVFALICGCALSIKKDEKNLDEKFSSAGYSVSERKNGLFVDEKSHKWACVQCPDMQILDFDDITDVEMVEAGITYKSEGGVLRAVAGGALFGAAGAVVGASTATRKQKANNVYVNIYTKNLKTPTVKINVVSRNDGEQLLGMVKAMQNYSVQSDTKNASSASSSSSDAADEIAKYKSLLDSGAITQEEYDKKKSELLKL